MGSEGGRGGGQECLLEEKKTRAVTAAQCTQSLASPRSKEGRVSAPSGDASRESRYPPRNGANAQQAIEYEADRQSEAVHLMFRRTCRALLSIESERVLLSAGLAEGQAAFQPKRIFLLYKRNTATNKITGANASWPLK